MKKYALIPLLALPMLAGNPAHADVVFPDLYCSINFGYVEPITRVILADKIDNSSAADSDQSLEDFTHLHAVVTAGERYPITFEGNTAGEFTNYFKVFIDWDHDSSFDESEITVLDDYIYDSNGLDGQQVSGFIDVPLTAISGVTRMRVVKHYYWSDGECGEVGFGQAEDYTLDVTGGIEPEGMTSIAPQPAVTEGQSLIFSFDSLLSASDAADDTVAFRVTRVLSGLLTIGGQPFDSASNNLINNNHQAEWSAILGGAADNVVMFAVVAVASNGGESVPAISVRTSQVQPIPVTWTGQGTKRRPYQISSAEHLHAVRYQLDAHYRLTTDIDLGVAPWNTGSGWMPVGDYDVPFTGSLDGAGHAINGLFINRPDQEYVGLFGYVERWGETATLENLHLENASVSGGSYTGILAGGTWGAALKGNRVEGVVTGNDSDDYREGAGGIVGELRASQMHNNFADVVVHGHYEVGGLAGVAAYSTLSGNHVSGTVEAVYAAGGLVGYLHSEAVVTDNSSAVNVLAEFGAGGLLGTIESSTLSNSYTTGAITFEDYDQVGALIGLLSTYEGYETVVRNSYWYAQDELDDIGDIYTWYGGSKTVTNTDGLSLSALTQRTSFNDWDFESTWQIAEGINNGQPYLAWMADLFVDEGSSPDLLSPVGPQQVLPGAGMALDVSEYFSDPSDSVLTFSARGLPQGLNITPQGIIEGVAAFGEYEITVTATNETDRSVSDTFTLIVRHLAHGDGSAETPWQISTAAQLDEMRLFLDAHFELSANIDLDVAPWNTGEGWLPVGNADAPFTGSLNGNGYTISGLTINREDEFDVGLFGVAQGAAINNLHLADAKVLGSSNVGILVGSLEDQSEVTNSSVRGSVTGVVGANGYYGASYVGGLAGRVMLQSSISDSYAVVDVTGEYAVGGIVGDIHFSELSSSFVSGTVTADLAIGGGVVGLVGNGVTVTNILSTAAVSGGFHIGGLIGELQGASVSNSYSAGTVVGDDSTGSLVGLVYNKSDTTRLDNSFWNKELSTRSGVGEQDVSGGGRFESNQVNGLTATELRTQSSFIGWDFNDVWGMAPGYNKGWPFLQWMYDLDLGLEGEAPQLHTPIINPVVRAQSISLDVASHFSTPQGDLVFTASGLPHGAQITASGLIQGAGAPGRYTVSVTATNDDGLSVSTLFTLVVIGFSAGEGTLAEPWQISSAEQLDEMRGHLNAHFELTADIDLSGRKWQPIGNSSNEFRGSLNGKGHAIRGLTVELGGEDLAGLFGQIRGGVVQSLALIDATVSGDIAGVLVGADFDSVFSQIHLSGSVEGHVAGGLAGVSSGSQIADVVSEVDVYSPIVAGGLVGLAEAVDIAHSYVSGSLQVDIGEGLGGLIGHAVSMPDLDSSYWLASSASAGIGCAEAPCVTDPETIAALSLEQLRQQQNFTGWDFDSIWDISPLANNGMPFLREVDSHLVRLQRPILGSLNVLGPVEEGATMDVTFDSLLEASNATDSDGTITGFRLISVESGAVQIADENFNVDDNAVVDAERSLAWLSDEGQSGNILAFTVVALDNDGLLSDPPVEVVVQVTKKPESEPQPEPEPEPEPEPQPGSIVGQPENPIHLDNSTLQPGSYLEHVVISGADTVIPPDVSIGPGVKFAADVPLPPGLDLTGALPPLEWVSGDNRVVADLEHDVIDGGPTILRAMQVLEDYEPSGNQLSQESTGELRLVTPDMTAVVLPVSIGVAGPEDSVGTHIDENGAIVIVTNDRRKVVSLPVLDNQNAFTSALALLGLEFSYDRNTNLVVVPQSSGTDAMVDGRQLGALSSSFHYSARPDVVAIPVPSHEVPGLQEYSQPGLGMITGLALVYEQAAGGMMRQLIVPVPADWSALRTALIEIPGIVHAGIDAQGVITVIMEDGSRIRGVMDYVVTHGTAGEDSATSIEEVGDISGNGMNDYRVVYANGHRQLLYVYPVE